MGTEQRQVSPHPVGLLAVFLLVTRWGTEEILADIAVSEAADQVGALLDRLQHSGILFAEGIETAITATILEHGTAHCRAQFLKRDWRLDGSQGLKIALIGRLGQFATPVEVGNPFAQWLPTRRSSRVIGNGPIDLQAPRLVDGRLHAQHLPLLVVHLHAILATGVLDPYPLGARLQVADHLPREAAMKASLCGDFLLQELEHITAAEGRDSMVQEPRVQLSQGPR